MILNILIFRRYNKHLNTHKDVYHTIHQVYENLMEDGSSPGPFLYTKV